MKKKKQPDVAAEGQILFLQKSICPEDTYGGLFLFLSCARGRTQELKKKPKSHFVAKVSRQKKMRHFIFVILRSKSSSIN